MTYRERGDFNLKIRVRDGYQDYVIDYHPFDVVGWDGYLYPWTFNINDFEPITGRIHMPPPSHQTFAGPNFVICSFCPRKLDFDPLAIPIPYHHSNLQSEEMIYYVDGQFSSRKGIEIGSVTLHPSGIPHGLQPRGSRRKSIGATETHELAVMCDTFHPLKLSKLAGELDGEAYAYSWYEEPGRRTRTTRIRPGLHRTSSGAAVGPFTAVRPTCERVRGAGIVVRGRESPQYRRGGMCGRSGERRSISKAKTCSGSDPCSADVLEPVR
jgi:hypothetical protein